MSLTRAITVQSGVRPAWASVSLPMLVATALLLSFPLWAEAVGLYPYLGIEVVIWMLYGLGYNLLLGYTGLPSFGHGAFFGVGAYAYGLCTLGLSQSPWLGLCAGGLAGGASAALVGALVARRRGIYFALMTIACGQVFWFVSMKWRRVTGGEDGLLNLHRGQLGFGVGLGSNVTLFYFAVGVLGLALVFLRRLVHSPFGRALQAIRMNEARARFVGYDVWLTKFLVFTLSGIFAGLAGGLLAISQESAYPDVMSVHASGLIVMAVLIGGGTVSFWGPVVGALVFIVARDLLGALTPSWLLWYGLLFMAVVLFKPEGIAGAWQDAAARLRRQRRVTLPPPAPHAREAPNGSV
jgi:branched-chain amino acid transport system permease protein